MKIVDNANYPDLDGYYNLSLDDKNILRSNLFIGRLEDNACISYTI